MKKVIFTEKAPAAVGPYSQAIEANGHLFVSGQIGIDPLTGKMVEGGLREQIRQVLINIGRILGEAGYGFEDVVKSTCLLKDMSGFRELNEVYAEFYKTDPPARAAYGVVDLPLGALVEIETIAMK